MADFISEDDLQTFEGFLKYQAIDPAASTPEDLAWWRRYFDEAVERRAGPKVGRMKLQPIPGEQKYAVAIRDGADLWLTFWVRCSRKGEVFIMYPRGDREWDAHASYHLDGTFHQKSHDLVVSGTVPRRQPLTGAFRGIEYLGAYAGHGGKSIGAICDPAAFDGVVVVEPGILGPVHGSVAIDLAEPGCEPRPYPGQVMREVFPREGRPSLIITIAQTQAV